MLTIQNRTKGVGEIGYFPVKETTSHSEYQKPWVSEERAGTVEIARVKRGRQGERRLLISLDQDR